MKNGRYSVDDAEGSSSLPGRFFPLKRAPTASSRNPNASLESLAAQLEKEEEELAALRSLVQEKRQQRREGLAHHSPTPSSLHPPTDNGTDTALLKGVSSLVRDRYVLEVGIRCEDAGTSEGGCSKFIEIRVVSGHCARSAINLDDIDGITVCDKENRLSSPLPSVQAPHLTHTASCNRYCVRISDVSGHGGCSNAVVHFSLDATLVSSSALEVMAIVYAQRPPLSQNDQDVFTPTAWATVPMTRAVCCCSAVRECVQKSAPYERVRLRFWAGKEPKVQTRSLADSVRLYIRLNFVGRTHVRTAATEHRPSRALAKDSVLDDHHVSDRDLSTESSRTTSALDQSDSAAGTDATRGAFRREWPSQLSFMKPGVHHFHCVKCGQGQDTTLPCHRWVVLGGPPAGTTATCSLCTRLKRWRSRPGCPKANAQLAVLPRNPLSPSFAVLPACGTPRPRLRDSAPVVPDVAHWIELHLLYSQEARCTEAGCRASIGVSLGRYLTSSAPVVTLKEKTPPTSVASDGLVTWNHHLQLALLKSEVRDLGCTSAGEVELSVSYERWKLTASSGQTLRFATTFLVATLRTIVAEYGIGTRWDTCDPLVLCSPDAPECTLTVQVGISTAHKRQS